MIVFFACSKDKPQDTALDQDYEMINVHPHDSSYFTQGFEFRDSVLVEGTGRNGTSRLIKYNVTNSQVYSEIILPDEYFGEGTTVLNGKVYQLTWTSGKCFVYDYETLAELNTFNYTGEGWGLTNNGTDLIMSNGSSMIYFRDPNTFEIKKTLSVKTSSGASVHDLNELEFADSLIWANIWEDNNIISIDPITGTVTNKYNMSDLRIQALDGNPYSDVLNGIAYKDGTFFVTGKYWPYIFEIKFLRK